MCIEYSDNIIGYREDLIEEQRKWLSQMATDKNYCASEIEDAVKLIKSLEEEAKDGKLITIGNNPMRWSLLGLLLHRRWRRRRKALGKLKYW